MSDCRHCNKNKVCRPRGLCWDCYYQDEIRMLYPSTHKNAHRGFGNFCGKGGPCEPTNAVPGSEGKIAALEVRAELGQELWHADDAKLGLTEKKRRAGEKVERNDAIMARFRAGATVKEIAREFGEGVAVIHDQTSKLARAG